MLVAGNTKQSPANRAIFLQIVKRAFLRQNKEQSS